MKTFRKESPGGCTSDTAKCAYYEITYPVFHGINARIAKRIDQVLDTLFALDNPIDSVESKELLARTFLRSYEQFMKEMPDLAMGWHFSGLTHVNVLTDTMISMDVEMDFFTGGAHGGSGVYFLSLDPRSGKKVTLDDVLRPGYQQKLTQLGEIAFRKVRVLSDTTSLMEAGFEFPEDEFSLNDNYGFLPEGITFYYNNYEIAPYVIGPTQIVIPYTSLTSLLK